MEPYYYYALILNENGEKEKAISLLNKALSMEESFLSSLTKNNIKKVLEAISN